MVNHDLRQTCETLPNGQSVALLQGSSPFIIRFMIISLRGLASRNCLFRDLPTFCSKFFHAKRRYLYAGEKK